MIAVRNISRFLVAGLFIFSGFVKIVDPVGMSIKLDKYFHVFDEKLLSLPLLITLIIPFVCLALFLLNLTYFTEKQWWRWLILVVISVGSVSTYLMVDSVGIIGKEGLNYSFLSNISLLLSVLLTVIEICLGIALLTLYRIKETSWMLLGLILFFTWLTLFTALTGQPKDCGCFGDFMKLSPWTSFGKDIILLVLILIIFVQRNNFKSKTNNLTGAILNLSSCVFWVFFANYNLNHLPVIDFRNYAVGNNITELMNDGDQKEKTGYAVLKDGWKIELYDDFTKPEMEHFKAPYEWIGTIPMVSGKQPTVTNFNLYLVNEDGGEVDNTKNILIGTKMLYIINKLEKDDNQEFGAKLKELSDQLRKNKIELNVVSGEFKHKFDEFNKSISLDVPYHIIDKDEAKAILRGKSGLLLLKDGIVKGKWHINDIPTIEEVNTQL